MTRWLGDVRIQITVVVAAIVALIVLTENKPNRCPPIRQTATPHYMRPVTATVDTAGQVTTGGGVLDDLAELRIENARLRKALAECQQKGADNEITRTGGALSGGDHGSVHNVVRSPRIIQHDIFPPSGHLQAMPQDHRAVATKGIAHAETDSDRTLPVGNLEVRDGVQQLEFLRQHPGDIRQERGDVQALPPLQRDVARSIPDCALFVPGPLSDGYVDGFGRSTHYTRYRPEWDNPCWAAEVQPYTAATMTICGRSDVASIAQCRAAIAAGGQAWTTPQNSLKSLAVASADAITKSAKSEIVAKIASPAFIRVERSSSVALARSGLPTWSTSLNDFRGDWDAPPRPQPIVSPRMMAALIRRPSNPPEPVLPTLCDDSDVHGPFGTERYSGYVNYEYLADKCFLIHDWKRSGQELHVYLAIHGYPSPGAAYDLFVPWEVYAGAHWLGVCTTLSGCRWLPVDPNAREGVTVEVPMDLPFEQPALLRSMTDHWMGGKP